MNKNEMEEVILTNGKVGAVMVVGAGVSGIQGALDLANSGFKVYLVEKEPAIGGKMSKLDKTFPTNDCSMCILSPKFLECSTNPNISIITGAQIESVDGDAGHFKVGLKKEPRYVDPELCVGCGVCSEYCPVNIPDVYNEKLSMLKGIYIPFAQAVPAISVVDSQQCLFFRRRACQICRQTCKNKALDFHQKEEKLELEVGSVILAPGYETFEPELQSQYGYKRFRNVITSLEYERILSASGPYEGKLLRPSDRKKPEKIAWIQCVGSRDINADQNTYCSGVCCMYAMKQVILSKEHYPQLETVVLHNDVRAYGKGFERYYDRAKRMDGVRFVWSKTTVVREIPETKNVVLRYRAGGSELKEEEFDLVVLSVGLTSTSKNKELAETLQIETNSHGFCESPGFSPLNTSREGVYACGVFQAPMDIPDSVTMASGAASLASQFLAKQRGTLVEEKLFPPERDVTSERPRVGVFVCRCGTNIAKGVDVTGVAQYAKGLPRVAHAEESTFSCSIDSITHMVKTIKEKELNRVVVAACTPRTHEPVFQNALKEAGLNPYLFEMANIREHCSLVHMGDRLAATRKACDLLRMAVAKSLFLQPLHRVDYSITRAALVVGAGIAGMVSALSLANQGIEVHLLEKEKEPGGIAKRLHYTLEGDDVQAYIRNLIREVSENPTINLYTEAQMADFYGYVGNFTSEIHIGSEQETRKIAHGATIIATGAEEFKPEEYLYGQAPGVVTSLELEAEITGNSQKFREINTTVMIQCVGSRNSERRYCSRVCCNQSVKNALKLIEINPEMEVYVLYRDMRTYAFREDYYREAAEKGVKFIRYDENDKPDVKIHDENGERLLRVTLPEPTLEKRIEIDADMIALGAATVAPVHNKMLSKLFKVPLNEDNFFMEAHMKLRPVDFSTEGIFMCGLAHAPKSLDETISQAQAAASRAITILTKTEMQAGGTICRVNPRKCSACGLCQEICPYGAIEVDGKEKVAVVNEVLCKGCGICASSCRGGALDVGGVSDQQTLTLVRSC